MKHLCITCLLVGLVFSTCKAQSDEEIDCIQRILEQDALLGEIRNHPSDSLPLKDVILNYARALEALDYDNCPHDFRYAFMTHIKAWKDMMPVVDQYPNLRGEMHDLFSHLSDSNHKDLFNQNLNAIWRTWENVEALIPRE